MNDDQMEHFKHLTEMILSKPASERERFLKEVKRNEMQYFERIEHLIKFLTTHDDGLEKYAHRQIKQILDDLSKR